MGQTEPTGYWTFFCNPARWEIDKFLLDAHEFDDYTVTDWQAGWFHAGQLGVIRVGVDKRSRTQLSGRARLQPGIYAIVKILGGAELRVSGNDSYWLQDEPKSGTRQKVNIRYEVNLIGSPLLLEDLKLVPGIRDVALLAGKQASSWPLDPATFETIWQLADADGGRAAHK